VFDTVDVIGSGRVGSAVAARLVERGVAVREDAELVLLCVPDGAIADVARSVDVGPWIAHVSGATPLRALEPHTRRFSVHPLQTFTRARGAEQLDGAWAAVTGETDEAIATRVRDGGKKNRRRRTGLAMEAQKLSEVRLAQRVAVQREEAAFETARGERDTASRIERFVLDRVLQ
jgi:hypothetical protein